MTDILSLSPYAYLDDLPPAERLAARRLQEHRRNAETGSVVDTARRARDFEFAEYENRTEMITGTCREPFSREIVGVTIWDNETKTSVSFGPMYKHRSDELLAKCDSLLTMCAELIEALGPFGLLPENGEHGGPLVNVRAFYECETDARAGKYARIENRAFERARATLARARKLLEGGE